MGEEVVEKKTSNDIDAVHKGTEDVSVAFPDICETPPPGGGEPIPIPYPNTALAADTSTGSKKVKVDGKEVIMKNASYYEKSTGDEPGHGSRIYPEQISTVDAIKRILTSRALGIPLWAWSVIAIGSLGIIWILTSNALQPIVPYELS